MKIVSSHRKATCEQRDFRLKPVLHNLVSSPFHQFTHCVDVMSGEKSAGGVFSGFEEVMEVCATASRARGAQTRSTSNTL